MNKKKIVEELNEYVKGLNSKLSVKHDRDDDLVLRYNRIRQAWFCEFNRDRFTLHVDSELGVLFIKEGYLTKFYNKAIELMDKYGDKYTVQVFRKERGYLHVIHDIKGYNDVTYDVGWYEDMDYLIQTKFTKSEIEKLKKRDDIAIDWDKAIIKEVTD